MSTIKDAWIAHYGNPTVVVSPIGTAPAPNRPARAEKRQREGKRVEMETTTAEKVEAKVVWWLPDTRSDAKAFLKKLEDGIGSKKITDVHDAKTNVLHYMLEKSTTFKGKGPFENVIAYARKEGCLQELLKMSNTRGQTALDVAAQGPNASEIGKYFTQLYTKELPPKPANRSSRSLRQVSSEDDKDDGREEKRGVEECGVCAEESGERSELQQAKWLSAQKAHAHKELKRLQATNASLLATHNQPLTACYSLLATHYLLLTTSLRKVLLSSLTAARLCCRPLPRLHRPTSKLAAGWLRPLSKTSLSSSRAIVSSRHVGVGEVVPCGGGI